MSAPHLDARLRAVADSVRTGVRLCDVGCDHAFLICTLALEGHVTGGIACDVRPLPLQKARELVEMQGLGTRVAVRLCDGLAAVNACEVDDIAIAGMGGETISGILARTPWLRDPQKRLILQPQTKAPVLRDTLYAAGFELVRERGVCAGRFVYTVLTAQYTGIPHRPDALERLVGALGSDTHPDSRSYLLRLAGALHTSARGHALHEEGLTQSHRLETLALGIERLTQTPKTVDEQEASR